MLKVVSVEKALEIIKEEFSFLTCESEAVALDSCFGRTLACDIISRQALPGFNRSTVDGFALRASDTYGCSEGIPSQLELTGEILMGEKPRQSLGEGQCIRISTGGMLPSGADSVAMLEYTDSSFEDICLVYKSVSPFENVTKKGDDIQQGAVVLRKGRLLSSRDVGILAGLGESSVRVFRRPRVAVISTGDEICEITEEPDFGRVRDINSHLLSALMTQSGCECKSYGIVRDVYDEIYSVVEKAAAENDIVLISGGSSAGARDMTAEIIAKQGQVFFHGIAMKPGKPTILGKIGTSAVFGLPGHPAAAYFVARRLVTALTDMVLCRESESVFITGRLTENISSNHGREEIICVNITPSGIEPLYGKSSVVSLLSRGNGYIIIDRNCEGLKKGDEVKVYLFR